MGKHRVTTVVVAAVAIFAIAGGATAATKYIITSTHQIKPSVLQKLRTQLLFKDQLGSVVSMCPSGTDTTGQCEVAASDARCPSPGIAMGGGFDGGSSPPLGAFMGYNEPDSDGRGWHIIMGNAGSSTSTFQTVAVCVVTSVPAGAAHAGVPSSVRAQISREVASMRTRR
jgi:hypothetical protein